MWQFSLGFHAWATSALEKWQDKPRLTDTVFSCFHECQKGHTVLYGQYNLFTIFSILAPCWISGDQKWRQENTLPLTSSHHSEICTDFYTNALVLLIMLEIFCISSALVKGVHLVLSSRRSKMIHFSFLLIIIIILTHFEISDSGKLVDWSLDMRNFCDIMSLC